MKTDKKYSYNHFTLKATLKPLKQQTRIFSWNKILKTFDDHQIVKIVEMCCDWLKYVKYLGLGIRKLGNLSCKLFQLKLALWSKGQICFNRNLERSLFWKLLKKIGERSNINRFYHSWKFKRSVQKKIANSAVGL